MAMSSGRPGGLTTMAVMNLVFAGWGALVALGFTYQLLKAQPRDDRLTHTALLTLIVMLVVRSLLLLFSGIGYLRQSRVFGWFLGLVYALFGIVEQVVTIFVLEQDIVVANVIGLVYPLETAVFLLVVFRRDFGTSE